MSSKGKKLAHAKINPEDQELGQCCCVRFDKELKEIKARVFELESKKKRDCFQDGANITIILVGWLTFGFGLYAYYN